MARLRILFTLIGFGLSASSAAAEWKPAPSPLMTKWGKQVTPQNAWQEYPRPQLVRKEWQNLNGLWEYAITAKDGAKPEKPDGQILVPFAIESALSGVGKHITKDQNLWYRRSFAIPSGWKGKRVLLHFQAVDWEATVFVNGKEFATHRGGFDPFEFDITDALKAGDNELIVKVWDPTDAAAQPRGKQVSKPGGIWYTPVSGIWQTVWLEPVPERMIEEVKMNADYRGWHQPEIKIRGDKNNLRVKLEINYRNANDRVVSESITKDVSVTGSTFDRPIPIVAEKKRGLRLWTSEDPFLYTIKLSLSDKRTGQDIDSIESYFALREIKVARDDKGIPRLMLNGKPYFQIGPLDQGWWPDGLLTPPSDAAMKYDLEVLKKLGFNMLRKHIKVEPARYYYHCDKLGLLVWQDMPSGGVPNRGQLIPPNAKTDARFTDAEKKQFRAELKAMIDHLRFFPCIAAWVPFNEGWGQHDTNEILEWVKKYDPTRLVDGPSGWADRGFGDMKDMHNYPGPGMFPPMPERASVLGEFGGLGLPLPGHLWKETNNWGYRTFKTTEDLRQHYHLLTRRLHPLIGKGLCAAVYTQTTDVEVEVNGLMTYDREVIKLDPKETAKWHAALFGPPPEYREVVPTSEKTAQKWFVAAGKPAEGWEKPGFDYTPWVQAEGGFGTKNTPGAVVRTEWKSPDIRIVRTFDLKQVPKGEVMLRIHHDEDAEVFINGTLAAKLAGFTTDYTEAPISTAARKSLKPGLNKIAVHCHQTGGGQYIDVGLVEVK